jgi:tetratricopeptide (TPR) repeat protein
MVNMVMSPIRKNPYIIGRPVSEAAGFFDRQNLFDFLADSLPQAQVILLYGQRRIGKSSVLAQIPVRLQTEPHCFVVLSLEGKSQKELVEVLHDLSRDIREALDLPITLPTIAELRQDPYLFADRFLVAVQAHVGEPELVLLLDEFDALGNYSPDAAATHLFPYLSEIIQRHKFLHIIPVIGRRLDDLPTLLSLFRNAPKFEINLLEEKDARQLITQISEDVLFYEEGALQAIWELTSGHPYFTQVLCFALFSQARDDDWWQITREDVDRGVDRALELGEGGLAWFWDGLPIPERVFFAAAATAVEQNRRDTPEDLTIRDQDPLMLLEEFGVDLTACLYQAQENLLEWDYLHKVKSVNAPETVARGSYKVTIELVRRWLVQRHGVKREIWELEGLNPTLQVDYAKARDLRGRGEFSQAIPFYEQVLAINSNYIGALFELAECLLVTKRHAEAVKLFQRVALVDELRAQDGLIRSRLGLATTLIERDQFPEAERLLQRVLQLDPTNPNALELREKIRDRTRTNENKREKSWGRFVSEWRWNLLGRSAQKPDKKGDSGDSDPQK